MDSINWSGKGLTRQKLGAFGEHLAKMALISHGVEIYTSEVDDHGIDFLARTGKGLFRIQVKTIHGKSSYVFMRKKYFDTADPSLYLLLILLDDNEMPSLYLIPAMAWVQGNCAILVDHEYIGKKSQPEYGVNLSKRNLCLLDEFRLEKMIDSIL